MASIELTSPVSPAEGVDAGKTAADKLVAADVEAAVRPADHAPQKSAYLNGSLDGGVRMSGAVSTPTFCKSMVCVCLAVTLIFCIAVSGLAIALQSWRPEVLITSQPRAPAGYYYGGATYQGMGNWVTNKRALPTARSDLTAVSITDQSAIYLIGGIDETNSVLADILFFDPIFETYNTSLASMPTPRYRFGATNVGSKIYVAGGCIVTDGDAVKTMIVYDTLTNTWTAAADMSIERSDISLAAYNGQLYAFGGYGIGFDMSVTGTLNEAYNPTTGTWTQKAAMPTPRGDLEAVTFGNRIFVLGGWNDVINNFVPTVEAYYPVTDTWAKFANMLVPKGDFAVAVYRGQIFAIGGEVWSGLTAPCPWDTTQICDINEVPTHDMISFDPSRDPASQAEYGGVNSPGGLAPLNEKPGVWVPRSPMPGARFRFTAASNPVAQSIFVFGGAMERTRVVDTVTAFYDTEHPQTFMHYKM